LSPFGSEFEGWDNPFTEGGAISKDADLILRLWKEQRLGQYGRKEAPIKEALIPSTSEASIATSAGSVQIPRKSSQQGDQEVRPPPKNGITWGPVGSAGSPKSKKKGEKFRCCSVM